MTNTMQAGYANPFSVKLPLLRVAHASEQENEQQLNQVRSNLEEKARQNRDFLAHQSLDAEDDSLSRDISSKGVPTTSGRQRQQPANNPLLFDFEHYHDPELTPRKKWQQKTVILDAQLAEEKKKLQLLNQKSAQMKAQFEKELLAISSKLRQSESESQVLKDQLAQETRLKEEYHMSFKRAQFDLDKVQERIQNERDQYRDKIGSLEDVADAKQSKLNSLMDELAELKDENHRLENAVVNKDSQNQQLEKFYEQEKERRVAETGELRRMLDEERARAVAALREAEQNSTKIFMFERQTENAERQVSEKEKKIEDLTKAIDQLRKEQVETEKAQLRQLDALKQAKEEGIDERSQSLQIRLNVKEAEMERMENLLIEMHKKMDELKQERHDADLEAKEATRSLNRLQKDFEVLQTDASAQRKTWQQQLESQDLKLREAQMQCWRKDLTIQGLEKQEGGLREEIERLKRTQNLESGIARLPTACLEDLNQHDKIREVKSSALHEALMDLKSADKGRNDMIQKIEELEQRQKNAYLRLYDRVGQEIGTQMHKTLEQREREVVQEQEENQKLTSEELEMKQLRTAQENAERIGQQQNITLNDLFAKYNI